MFDSLSDKLQAAFDGLKKQGKLTDKDVERAAREIRLALLEADVNFKVVKQFVDAVKGARLGRRGAGESHSCPAVHQDRQRRADGAHGVGQHQADVLAAPADAGHDGRSSGLGQDHGLRQVGQLPALAGQESRAGGR